MSSPTRAPRRRGPLAGSLLLVAAVVAVAGALLLPLAPVVGERPVVTWPGSPAAPESTTLLLTNQVPESLDLRFSCATAQRAGRSGGTVLATLRPDEPTAAEDGLVVRVADRSILLEMAGERVQLGASDGPCDVRVRVDGTGLTVVRDGAERVHRDDVPLPQVDALVTSVHAAPAATAADLSVRVAVVDVFASSPTRLKLGLAVLVALCVVAVLVLLLREDRRLPGRARRRLRPGGADVAVTLVLLAWVALAPTTDDDGYYAAMARNVGESGYVGNYFQMGNASFAPFTWVWYALHGWQQLGGDAVVWLRLPAVAAGLLTWCAVRRFAWGVPQSPAAARWLPPVLATAFLAWWLPYCMGVRPETVVALCAALTLVLVADAAETGRLGRAAVAAAVAGLGVAAHPTGAVALAPLLVALPRLWGTARETYGPRRAVVRMVAVTAAGTVASLAAFMDASLHDVLAGRARFAAIETPLDWTDEIQRYQFLLSDIAMGSYAKRAPVLLALVLLVWFVALHVASRVGDGGLPWRTSLAGWALAASFVLLWITPSKWTHHFGSLAGLGPAFVALLVVTGIPAVGTLARRHGRPVVVPWVLVASLVPVVALALQGPNAWPYWWNLGMPHPRIAPAVGGLELGSPVVVVAFVCVVVVAVRLAARRAPGWRPVWPLLVSAVLVVGFLAGTVTYLVTTFGVSAARAPGAWSPGAANLTDPGGCSASDAVAVYDDRRGRPLARDGPPAPQHGGAFVAGGFWPGTPPPGTAEIGPDREVWGSFASDLEAGVGRFTTDWFALPDSWPDDARVVTFVAGHADGASRLTMELGDRRGASVTTLERRRVTDRENATSWRGAVLAGPDDVPAGADVLRLVAVDGETTAGGWLAVTAPELQTPVPLREYLPADATVMATWQLAFLFPCVDQVDVAHGITEPPRYAIAWAQPPFRTLGDEATWRLDRRGLGAGARRLASLVSPASVLTADPSLAWGEVYRFRYAYPPAAYHLEVQRGTVPGWRPPAGGARVS